MKVPVKLKITTIQRERSEFETTGYAQISESGTTIIYQTDDYYLAVKTDGKTATVTRRGIDGYVMTLEENRSHDFTVNNLHTAVKAEKLRLKTTQNQIDFWAKYTFANDANTLTQIIIKAIFI